MDEAPGRTSDRRIRWILRALGIAAVALLAGVVAAAWIGLTISLAPFRAQIEQAASRALGREVGLEGALEARIGFTVGILAERLHVANPEGWEGRLLELGHVRVLVSLPALLRRDLHLRELVAQDATLDLEQRPSGDANWIFARASVGDDGPSRRLAFVGFDRISLERLEITLSREGTSAPSFALHSLTGTGAPGEPLRLGAQGRLGAEAFGLRIATDSLRAGRDRERPWAGELTLEIAGTRVAVSGRFGFEGSEGASRSGRAVVLPSGRRAPDLRLHVEGRRLSDLDRLAGAALPPWGPFALDGRLRLTAAGLDASEATVRLGASTLAGRLRYDRGPRAAIDVHLESPGVQLDDFRTGDWSAFSRGPDPAGRETPEEDAVTEGGPEGAAPPPALFNPETLARTDARIAVLVREVRSGDDVLGRGELRASVENAGARLTAALDVPGGSFEMAATATPVGDAFDTTLALRSDRFDYGVLARRIDPEAEAEGRISVAADLHARTPRLAELLAGADGTLAFAIFPENLEAEVFDLWAANLLLALLPKLGDTSRLNCAAARMRIEAGRMREEELVVDTSSMRVGGRVEVDFGTQTIDAVFAPVAKVPRMFSAATPVRVRGGFDDFGVGVLPRDVVFTVARMAVSPLVAPLTRVVRGSLERDGSELCESVVAAPDPTARP